MINISEKKMPLVSIITVVRNGELHLREAIESIIGQNWPNVEYIIIDGGSTDGTLDIIRQYNQQIDYWVSEPDQGIFDAMNKGIARASGELIGLLNADDWYEPDAVESVVKAYIQKQLSGIYYGDTYLVHVDMGLKYELHSSLEFWRGMTVCHQAMFVHRDVYDNLGCYDTAYRLASDFDFFVRTIRCNIPFIALNRYIVNFRDNGASARSLALGNQEISAILKKNYGCFNQIYLRNLLLTTFGLATVSVGKLIRSIAGERCFYWVRRYYFRLFSKRGNHVRT